ncbi:MAG: sugar ABC transporter permease, partial [Verrucomicrobia bacterium]|nr:sugar ABC transporter permease [Verrucomicrobiota bacterium]
MAPLDNNESVPDAVQKPSSDNRRSSAGRQSTFQWAPYLFLLPTLGIMFLFSVFPMLYGFWMSVQAFDVIRGTAAFVGLGNYLKLLHDPQFGLSVLNTAWYTLSVVPLIVAGSIAIAVFLRESRPARLLARVGFYIPFVLSPVVVATSWKWLLNEDLGVIDGFLKWVGVSTIPWLTDDFSARVCVVLITVWNLLGFYMLMVLAGLSQISAELYEAARIEGATGWQRFWRITLPMLRPTILLVFILATIHATQAFEMILLLTAGGPGDATR